MAILGDIRKRSMLLILVIGGALFIFIISSIFDSGFGGGSKAGDAVIEVDDITISYEEFNRSKDRFSRMVGPGMTDAQVSNRTFDTEVRRALLGKIFEDLGFSVEADQIADYVEQAGWHRSIPQFADENGNFDKENFQNTIYDWSENVPAQYELWKQDEQQIIFTSKERMLQSLVKVGMNASLQEGVFAYKTNNNKIDVEFVRVPYTAIPDSSVVVTKDEIAAYVKENPEDFKQEDARNIRYVFFELKPSEADEKAAKEAVESFLTGKNPEDNFRTTQDLVAFFSVNSDKALDTLPKQKNQLPQPLQDTIAGMNIGDVYGPYKDGDTYNLARLVGKDPEANVRARHVLIAYKGATRASDEVTRTKEEAREKAQSVLSEARKADADFAELARENSDGPTASRGGDLGFFQEGQMAGPFNDYCFENPAGSIGLVETEFGFHVIKVEEKQDLYQVAVMVREIIPSDDTENAVYNEALTFEKKVREAEADEFANIAKEDSYVLRPVNKMKAMDENLPGLGNRRDIVRWAFNKETEAGDILRFDLTIGYVIVQMTKEFEEGTMGVEEASVKARPEIIKRKKADMLIAKYKGKSMEDITKEASVSVNKGSSISLGAPTLPAAGKEPGIVGAAFALDVDQESDLLIGETGVFKIKVLKKNEAIKLPNFAPYATTVSRTRLNRVASSFYNSLRDDAEIKDLRSNFY